MDPDGSDPIRVLLVDGDGAARSALAAWFATQRDIAIVAAVGSAEAAMAMLATARPDVVVVDQRLPGTTALRLCQRLQAMNEGIRCVIHANTETSGDAAPANGTVVILKQLDNESLLGALRRPGP